MQQSLSDLHTFCDDTKNNLPATAFSGFASFAGFDMNNHIIDTDSKLKTIDDLYFVWKKFLEKEGIVLGDSAIEKIEGILIPKYNPTERIMVTVALTKIRKELKGSLRIAFDEQFPLPISIFSPYQNLLNFKNQWGQFLLDHASEIDESLAKKLDTIIVTNGDIQKELLKS
ncbi:TPA: hypothetical protein DCZ39_04495 [Patescibacteria group bacterium]|nr:hypothetical protein [Candidatus Gracilibacteria bacterium]